MCGISWEDAKAFYQWLTKKERTENRLAENQEYRLPTDLEWSKAVGLGGENGSTPEERSGKIADVYPWGTTMPPLANGRPAGNYAGEEAKDGNWPSHFGVIAGYNDGFARTSPVGTFPANQYGLFDLGGNVWEWCEDLYKPSETSRVLRGGSWINNDPRNLLSSNRNNDQPGNRNDNNGFRLVLAGAGGARKVLKDCGEIRRGQPVCAVGAKQPPNLCAHAPAPGKRRGAGRGR